MRNPSKEQIKAYLERSGWKLRIAAVKISLYTNENGGETIIPTNIQSKNSDFLCVVSMAMIAESENRTVEEVRQDVTHEGLTPSFPARKEP